MIGADAFPLCYYTTKDETRMTLIPAFVFLAVSFICFWVLWHLYFHDVKVIMIERDDFLHDLIEECERRYPKEA